MRASLPFLAWALAAPVLGTASTPFIVTTKVTPGYWRATFSSPPLEIQGLSFFEEYYALIDKIAADRDVKVVVFDSNSPTFWLDHYDILNNVPYDLSWATYWGNVTRLATLPVLTVAAIRGRTNGGGAEVALTLDVRFGSRERAVYTQSEVGLGVVPGGGSLEMLPRHVGRSRALEIVLAADDVDADTMAAYGILNRAIPDADFCAFVDTFARRVAGWDKPAIAAAKSLINNRTGFPAAESWLDGFNAFAALFNTTIVQGRVAAYKAFGLQQDVNFEAHMAQLSPNFTGPGPYPHLVS